MRFFQSAKVRHRLRRHRPPRRDGFFFRQHEIAVIGGGDTAIDEAERAFADDKIEFAWNSEVAKIHGDDELTGVTHCATPSLVSPASCR